MKTKFNGRLFWGIWSLVSAIIFLSAPTLEWYWRVYAFGCLIYGCYIFASTSFVTIKIVTEEHTVTLRDGD